MSVLQKGMAVRRYVAAPVPEVESGGGGSGGGDEVGQLSSTPAKLWIKKAADADGGGAGGDDDVGDGNGDEAYTLHWTTNDSSSWNECDLRAVTKIWEPTEEVTDTNLNFPPSCKIMRTVRAFVKFETISLALSDAAMRPPYSVQTYLTTVKPTRDDTTESWA